MQIAWQAEREGAFVFYAHSRYPAPSAIINIIIVINE